ncbi:hypothetical protein [Noviherbaspirillum galbum]|uniref:Uncharacterized protein n=1 Tax=Noviherbaspirillum galbum TaxID=2709383 RepID=A0A6B3SRV7_9BURK|nr:hypothetical protein [Noviherbaspirillum galbum]NEX63381.1 hypothetical protein [Noviherbaspirillum galbum]
MASTNHVTLLSLNSRREPIKHQFYRGFKNVAYLAGYVYEIRANTIYLQMTNNVNLVLPVTVPPGVKMPSNFKKRQAIKMVCQVRSIPNADGSPGLVMYARSFERPNVLELPLRSAFDKAVPKQAHDDVEFKPYGAGYRQTDACNQVHLAGMVVGVNQRSVMINEDGKYVQSAAVDFLLRQDADEANIVPVRYYGKLAEKIASQVRRGDLILTHGKYRVKPIETGATGDDGKAEVVTQPYIHIDAPQQPSEFDILYMAEDQEFPRWMIELHAKFRLSQRKVPAQPAVVAPAEGAQPVAANDLESHPKWASLTEEEKEAARSSEIARRRLLG